MQTQKFKTLLKKNLLALKSMKNKCNSLCKKAKTQYSKNVRAKILHITNNPGM